MSATYRLFKVPQNEQPGKCEVTYKGDYLLFLAFINVNMSGCNFCSDPFLISGLKQRCFFFDHLKGSIKESLEEFKFDVHNIFTVGALVFDPKLWNVFSAVRFQYYTADCTHTPFSPSSLLPPAISPLFVPSLKLS